MLLAVIAAGSISTCLVARSRMSFNIYHRLCAYVASLISSSRFLIYLFISARVLRCFWAFLFLFCLLLFVGDGCRCDMKRGLSVLTRRYDDHQISAPSMLLSRAVRVHRYMVLCRRGGVSIDRVTFALELPMATSRGGPSLPPPPLRRTCL